MRTRTSVTLAGLSLAGALLTGCGMGNLAANSGSLQEPASAATSFQGKLMGGQQPITGATVALFAVGNSGYGSTATPLALSMTDSNGAFLFHTFTCPTAAPLYVLSISGNPQISNGNNNDNPAAELGAGGFTCDHLPSSVVVNEVSTVALAYTMGHYFSIGSSQISYGSIPCFYGTTTTDCTTATGNAPVTTADSFGGPAGTVHGAYSTGLYNADLYTIPAMVNVVTGYAQTAATANGVTTAVETRKINSLADVLANCVNSDPAAGGGTCGTLLSETSSTSPSYNSTNTLESAVFTALNPYANQQPLFLLIPADTPFAPTLTSKPNDWSIALSYSSPAFNLNVPTGAVSTIDIDTTGNVWFPSNGSQPGVGYFAPSTGTFSALLNTHTNGTAIISPTQVAIDQSGYVWANDAGSGNVLNVNGSNVNSVSVNNVGSAATGSTTSALTINRNGYVEVAVNVGGTGSSYQFDYITGNNAYLGAAPAGSGNTPPAGAFVDPIASLASAYASTGGGSVWTAGTTAALNPVGDQYNYDGSFAAHAFSTSNVAYAGQAVNIPGGANSDSFVALQAYEGNNPDGICQQLFTATCQPFILSGTTSTTLNGGAFGMALDGAGTLWASQSLSAGLVSLPVSGLMQATPKTTVQQFLHGASHGSTAVKPYGVAVDNSGNVWMSNDSGSTGTFTLTEVVGLAAPTVTPLSAQISGNSDLTATKPVF